MVTERHPRVVAVHENVIFVDFCPVCFAHSREAWMRRLADAALAMYKFEGWLEFDPEDVP